jgi:asparagine synthase (glutamine-hydrolysing)
VCGFVGVIDFAAGVDEGRVARMSELIVHRGPDDYGSYGEPGVALAARRLAIIDLSSAGRQPFVDEGGRYRLLFNGELYNYVELRRELRARGRSFRSATDTEVVLASFIEWGDACVNRFNGMWAIAIWDSLERRLFCSRDRFGEKPLYYRLDGAQLTFASELKAFRADAGRLRVNSRMARDYLAHGLIDHGAETFFDGINQLRPAHSMAFSQEGLQVTRYWSLEPKDAPAEPVQALRELLLDSIRLRLRSDVPLGTCLSGGLDSSAIASGAAYLRGSAITRAGPGAFKTFTSFFDEPELDERPFAEAVVRSIDGEGHFVSYSDRDLVGVLPAIVDAQDEPFRSTSITAQWFLMRAAHTEGVKVMLDGQGGDELFAGYLGHLGYFFAYLLLEGRLKKLAAEVIAHRRVRGLSPEQIVAALVRPFVPASIAWGVRARANGARSLLGPALRHEPFAPPSSDCAFNDRFRRQLHLVITTRLPELLHYEDRNSMAHSLEARVPFLDHRIAELAFSLAADYVIRNGNTKMILRDALVDLLPEPVRRRTSKLGFNTPEGQWLRGSLGLVASDVFESRSILERGLVDVRAARTRLQRHRLRQVSAGSELWRALNLELWARAFLDGPTQTKWTAGPLLSSGR